MRTVTRFSSGLIRERKLVGAAVLLLVVLVWIAGTNTSGMLIALGVVLVGFALFLWRRNRSIMRSVLRDLRPPDES
jgi:LPXTG-motif cell wall-anchored protein